MKNLIIFSLIILSSCGETSKKTKKKDQFYYSSTSEHYNKDTMSLFEIPRHHENDSLFYKCEFESKKGKHVIQMFSNIHHPSPDSGIIKYELDNLGVIYARSISWNHFTILESNNDSVNKLISFALGKILLEDKLRDCFMIYNGKAIDFTPPYIVKDKN